MNTQLRCSPAGKKMEELGVTMSRAKAADSKVSLGLQDRKDLRAKSPVQTEPQAADSSREPNCP